jgi:hypothetical protein
MSKASALYRWYLIIQKVKGENVYPSKVELKEFLESHDYKTSFRTIDRYLAEIRNVFGIDVKWNTYHRGYYIDREESCDFEGMLRLLEVCVTGDLLMNTVAEGRDALKYILFDSGSELKGIDHLGSILQAIKLHRYLIFDYLKFQESTREPHEIAPYALKEYQGRWYVVGTIKRSKKLYIFGLDRIEKLVIQGKSFVPNKKLDPAREFEDIIGVTRLDEQVEEVILSFTPQQGNYVKTLPWHRSQEVLVDNKKELRIRIRVIPNFELIQKILMQGKNVKVNEPKWLRKEVKSNFQQTLLNYHS